MNEMNSHHSETHEGASIRENELENGTSLHNTRQSSRQSASMDTSEEESTSNRGESGKLASVQDSSQQASTPPREPSYSSRKKRIRNDGSFSPKSPPSQKKNGKYARPRGPCPKGFTWDADRGVFTPTQNDDSDKNDSMNGDKVSGTNESSSGREKTSSRVSGSKSNGKNEERKKRSSPPVPSSTASTASSVPEKDEENDTKHYTRSKGGSSRRSSGRQSDSGYESTERLPMDNKSAESRSINECASILARVDEDSYQRALLQDASSITERILFPMCFPWNHSIVPAIRNFPKDIDELPAILHAEDDEFTPYQNGIFGYGGFEIGKERHTPHDAAVRAHGDTYLAATRRTDDVGVMELTVIDNEGVLDASSRLRKRKHQVAADSAAKASPSSEEQDRSKETSKESSTTTTSSNNDVIMRTENEPGSAGDASSLDYIHESYEHVKVVKKQKVAAAGENSNRMLVSVRFGSVSSRSSLFTPSGGNLDTLSQRPLLCEAVMPPRRNHRNQVADYATGEWDIDRAKWLKRDNLAWTQASASAGGYLSKLSYNIIPSVAAKKPRAVRVGVKLNGDLLSFQPTAGDTRSAESIARSILGLQDTIDDVSVPERPIEIPSMCMLDRERLMDTRVKRPPPRITGPRRKPPMLDCVPLELCGGAIRVVCTSPGTLQRTNIADLFRQPGKMCSVCWNEGDVKECSKCSLQVHTSCCAHGGVVVPSSNNGSSSWMCAVCCEGPKPKPSASSTSPSPRKRASTLPARYQSDMMLLGYDVSRSGAAGGVIDDSLRCSLCPHLGGAMSPCGTSEWSHEVCRIWSQSKEENEPIMPRLMSVCALCGMDGAVIKCAGSDCTVRFHPMCAIISVVDGAAEESVDTSELGMDKRLCGRFTVDILQCGDSLVPVGFCGFHNPSRDRFLYGCYPGGMEPCMRVPARKQMATANR